MRCILVGLMWSACSSSGAPARVDAPRSSDDGAPMTGDGPTDAPGPARDFAQAGPFTVAAQDQTLTMGECTTDGTIYTPSGAVVANVVLSHGFSRSPDNLVDLATHFASWGLRVTTPRLCHASIFDTDHPQNGRDLAAYGQTLPAPRYYAGHSAGGLASALALSADPMAAGLVGLDLTDAEGAAVAAVGASAAPRFGIMGEPSSCNASGNGTAAFTGAPIPGVRVTGATHCDFEMPTSAGCTSFCGATTGVADIVRGLATAYIFYQLNGAADAASWVLPDGAIRVALQADGTIAPL